MQDMRHVIWVLPCNGALPGSLPSFDLYSIQTRLWTNEGQVAVFVRGNTLCGEHVVLHRLVEVAYDLQTEGSQLSGGPPWAHRGIRIHRTLPAAVRIGPTVSHSETSLRFILDS
jgi:hypothetical protein